MSKSTLPKIFNEAVRQKPRVQKGNKPPTFKPSMLGSPCYRKIYYSYNRVPEETAFPIGTQRIVDLGSAIGDHIYAVFKKAGIAIDYRNEKGEIPIKFGKPCPEFPIWSEELDIKSGLIDLVSIIDGDLWLGEFKSSNARSYSELKVPKEDHFVQGIIYLYIFNKLLREGHYSHIPELAGFTEAKGMRWLYYNKDSSTMKEFTIERSDQVFSQIVTKIMVIKEHTKNDTLPPKTPHYCNSCPWAKRCARDEKK